MDDVLWMDARGQKKLLDTRELTAPELITATIERIEALDPRVNAVIHRMFEKALDAVSRPDSGRFAGIPLLIKDAICHTAGDPMHEGMGFLKRQGWTEPTDSYLAGCFRRAGFVFVGKTNLPELALAPTTEPVAYGATHNPWDLTRSAGGSSGGAAAAVASGMVAIAHANDWAGSIRIPASACGVVGLKPSRGRVSPGPRAAEIAGGRGVENVITRTVRDAADVLDAIAGYELGDPYMATSPDGSFSALIESFPALRVGAFAGREVGGVSVHKDCTAAVEAAARGLDDLGHRVDEAWPRALEEGMAGHLAADYGAHAARLVDAWSERTGRPIAQEDVEAETWAWAELGRSTTAAHYLGEKQWLGRWARDLAGWWRDHDVLVTPTLPDVPPKIGELATDPLDPWRVIAAQGRFGLFTAPWNVSGQPAISLPLHQADGMPIGVQLVAAPGREDILISVSAQLEEASGWPSCRPPSPYGE